MNRQIKFQLFDKDAAIMRDVLDIDFLHKYVKCKDGTDIFHYDLDTYPLRQYTGLTDRNGKEVYEGDVVKCSRGCPHLVEWVTEYGGTFLGGMPAFYLTGLNSGYSWTGEEEIIGNLYENPELLEVS